jgi:hypothetical protein
MAENAKQSNHLAGCWTERAASGEKLFCFKIKSHGKMITHKLTKKQFLEYLELA